SPGWSNCFHGTGHRRPSTLKRRDQRPSPYAYQDLESAVSDRIAQMVVKQMIDPESDIKAVRQSSA
ncbi:hypothetical protein, partial [Rhizobium leguminosarum]|uniref:hypothetical protein n=1 Tax=Rhizobium leguminosarum TaxID=384 RepID=UPI001FEE0ADF